MTEVGSEYDGKEPTLCSPEFAMLERDIERRVERAGLFGIDMNLSIGNPNSPHNIDIDADIALPGASIKKLFITNYLLSSRLENPTLTFNNSFVVDGGGTYDTEKGVREASVHQLVKDMLIRSGNTAANVLMERIGVNELNGFLKESGYEASNFVPLSKNDDRHAYEFGSTTPTESRKLLESLILTQSKDPILQNVVMTSLANTTNSKGVRNFYRQGQGVILLNKTGAYPAEGDQGHLRHDVGLISNGNTDMSYAIMTNASTRFGATLAEQTMAMIGHDITRYLGVRTPGIFGRTALRFAI